MDDRPGKAVLFSGTSLLSISQEVANQASLPLGKASIERYPDAELGVRLEDGLEGATVFLLQSIARRPNEYLVELLLMIDAAQRAGAERVVPVIPYFGYARQDRVTRPGMPIAARLVADLLEKAGAAALITIDFHAEQIEGFFSIPVKNLRALPLIGEVIRRRSMNDLIVVAPDVGGIKLARRLAASLGVDFAVVDKQRLSPDTVRAASVIGEIGGKNILLADDVCATAGTLVSAAKACREKGARTIYGAVSHGLFVGPAIDRIEDSPIETIWFGDTVPLDGISFPSTKWERVSVAPLLAAAMRSFVPEEEFSSSR